MYIPPISFLLDSTYLYWSSVMYSSSIIISLFHLIHEGRTAGFCALCAIQKHVSRALQLPPGRSLAPNDLVSNLRCILNDYGWSLSWSYAKDASVFFEFLSVLLYSSLSTICFALLLWFLSFKVWILWKQYLFSSVMYKFSFCMLSIEVVHRVLIEVLLSNWCFVKLTNTLQVWTLMGSGNAFPA